MPTSQDKRLLMTLKIRALITAVQNPEMLIPLTTKLVSFIIVPLTTKVNRPSVKMLIGRVKKIITGLIIALKMDRTIAAKTKLIVVSK